MAPPQAGVSTPIAGGGDGNRARAVPAPRAVRTSYQVVLAEPKQPLSARPAIEPPTAVATQAPPKGPPEPMVRFDQLAGTVHGPLRCAFGLAPCGHGTLIVRVRADTDALADADDGGERAEEPRGHLVGVRAERDPRVLADLFHGRLGHQDPCQPARRHRQPRYSLSPSPSQTDTPPLLAGAWFNPGPAESVCGYRLCACDRANELFLSERKIRHF
jgi:hypothetical protein